MANLRKSAPVRQVSLHADTPKRILKKQLSEDHSRWGSKWVPEMGFSVTFSKVKTADRPPPKMAWVDSSQPEGEEGIVAKKCQVRRPPNLRQSSLNQDSILLSHQELAERLRQAWKDREKGKQNLNIFLAHNVREKEDDAEESELTVESDKAPSRPKIVLPLKPEIVNENNYKKIFQKRMRRAHSVEEPFIPVRDKSKTVVVVPLVENPKHKEDKGEKPEDKPIDVIIRPMTAAAKREGFRSRTNSAFNSKENQRPPLVRASSVPLRPPSKPKFTPVKRRIKSAPRRKDDTEKEDAGRKFKRCVSVSGTEIETMVSLVSPEDSEAEEVKEPEKPKEKPPPPKSNLVDHTEKLEQQKNFTLRKAVKSVSFQQSSIHAVRSFSASFPARRGSVANALMINNLRTGNSQEKRATVENAPEEASEPKRRLRMKSAPSERSFEQKEDENRPLSRAMETPLDAPEEQPPEKSQPAEAAPDSLPKEVGNAEKDEEKSHIIVDTLKERQCWDMYRKMSQKGVKISFDTILRGVMTPTEYRLRRKAVAQAEEEAAAAAAAENNPADTATKS